MQARCSTVGRPCSRPACQQQPRQQSASGSSCTLKSGSSLQSPCVSALRQGHGLTPRLQAWLQFGLAQTRQQQRLLLQLRRLRQPLLPLKQPQKQQQVLLVPLLELLAIAAEQACTAKRQMQLGVTVQHLSVARMLLNMTVAQSAASRRVLQQQTSAQQQLQWQQLPAARCLSTCRWRLRWRTQRRELG